MAKSNNKTKLSPKFWVALVLCGLVGQIAWVVENMYLNVFIYKMFGASASDIAAMVAASAIAATLTTVLVGALADRYTELDDHNLNYSNLNWQEIKEMSNGNIIDIQSHSFDLHKNTADRSGIRKKKSETIEQYREFLGSDTAKMKMKMLEHTGKAPVAFAYPFGSFSPESKDILKDNGIKVIFTCEERINIIKKRSFKAPLSFFTVP